MIQRIQSVYLIVAAALMIFFLFLPLVNYNTHDSEFVFFVKGFQETGTGLVHYPTSPLVFLVSFIALLLVADILMYNRRIIQIRLGGGIILLHAILIILCLYYSEEAKELMGNQDDIVTSLKIPAFFPVISIILVLLANRAIRKDEKLVRSADRIR